MNTININGSTIVTNGRSINVHAGYIMTDFLLGVTAT